MINKYLFDPKLHLNILKMVKPCSYGYEVGYEVVWVRSNIIFIYIVCRFMT